MHLASKDQYLQRAVNAKVNVSTTNLTTDTSSASFSIFKQHNISAHATDEMLAKDLILTAGEILKIQVSHANIHVTASIVEYGKGD